jgi:hypothetical protein
MTDTEEEETGSPAAGACVLVLLGGGALAALFAASDAAGVLTVWTVGTIALWRAARHQKSMSDAANPAPPPGSGPSSGDKPADGTTVVRREGMLIYRRPDPNNPHRTIIEAITPE